MRALSIEKYKFIRVSLRKTVEQKAVQSSRGCRHISGASSKKASSLKPTQQRHKP